MAERFARTDEQQMLSSTLRELLGETADMDQTRELSLTTDAFDRNTWTALSEMGLVGLTLDEQHGGAGLSFADTAVVFEELGRVVAAVPLLSNLLAVSMIDGLGSDAQKRELLPPIASGDSIATLAVHEMRHGQVGAEFATTAEQGPDGWHVVGTKRFVTDAPNADVFVVVAASPDGPAAFVVPTSAVESRLRLHLLSTPHVPLARCGSILGCRNRRTWPMAMSTRCSARPSIAAS